MGRTMSSCCAFACLILFSSVASSSQEVIHALTGTVTTINESAKTVTVFQDNGTQGVFQRMADPKTQIAFNKKVADTTTAADKFDKSGAYAIVFYFGNSSSPTVVAFKNLGVGPFESTVGTVSKVEGHNRISVVDKDGATHTFTIDKDTVAEGGMGAVDGAKFNVNRGDRVRVVSTSAAAGGTALFIRDM